MKEPCKTKDQIFLLEQTIEERIFKDKTPAQRLVLQKARDFGVDLSLLLENLSLTPTERMLRYEAALDFAITIRNAVKTKYAKNTKTPDTHSSTL